VTHGGPDGEKFAAQACRKAVFSPLTGISTSGVSATKCKGLAAHLLDEERDQIAVIRAGGRSICDQLCALHKQFQNDCSCAGFSDACITKPSSRSHEASVQQRTRFGDVFGAATVGSGLGAIEKETAHHYAVEWPGFSRESFRHRDAGGDEE
jgi:hypothetical protein